MKLSKVAGVESARVDLGAGKATVEYDDSRGECRSIDRGRRTDRISRRESMKAAEEVELPIGGMTCAACARTVEAQLAHSPGVEKASVNFATRTASVSFNPAQTRVAKIWWPRWRRSAMRFPRDPQEIAEAAEARTLRKHLIVGAVFAIPVFILGMLERAPARAVCVNAAGVVLCRPRILSGCVDGGEDIDRRT